MNAVDYLVGLAFAVFGGVACLPADLRPEPGRVVVDVDMPAALRQAQTVPNQINFSTGDGWTVTLDRFLVSMGNMMLQGPSCTEYASAWYGRVLDVAQPGPQRLGQLWGLNGCRLTYEVMRPSDNAVLGTGVTEEDRTFMRNAVVPFASDGKILSDNGMAVYLRGSAQKDQIQISFDWGFSTGRRFRECQRIIDGQIEEHLPLVGGETTTLTIWIEPQELFAIVDPMLLPQQVSTEFLMQRIADADQVQGNRNGRVSIEELLVPKMTLRGREMSVAEILRVVTLPRMFKYDDAGSGCRPEFADDDGR